jgi:alkanesulfonate monooxygenase SsuD/methylene tetrahydromethanopterin reductase-like flavin-dependent oxidoreductase (luciferase family)
MIGGTGPKKTLRMVAEYGDACNIGDWVGAENMQKALDTLKEHCAALGRDYDTVEKTALCTVHLSGSDTVESVLNRLKTLAGMGFSHAIFNMPDVSEIAPLQTFGREIIPAAAGL